MNRRVETDDRDGGALRASSRGARARTRTGALALAFAAALGCKTVPSSTGGAPVESPSEADGRAADPSDAGARSDIDHAAADAASAATSDAGAAPAEAAKAREGMLLVPGGTFRMGADKGGEGDERPAHDVTLAPFWLDQTEVTQADYDACVAARACKPADPAARATFGGLFTGPKKPIVGVSWFDARDYCAWKDKRLPREAEFERAVRGDDGRRFPWGDEAPTHDRTVFQTNAIEEVGSHPTGRGPYGHDDLAGNVWEWMEDDYDPYAYVRDGAPSGRPGSCAEIVAAQNELRAQKKQGFTGSNPIPTTCEKAIRGGAYNYPGVGLRSTNRVHHPPGFRLRMTGLRCAKDA